DSLALFPSRAANGALYLWLTAAVAHAPAQLTDPDPLRADLLSLRTALQMTKATLTTAPGLCELYAGLAHVTLQSRPQHSLPQDEAAIEAVIRHMLDDPTPLSPRAQTLLGIVQSGDLPPLTAPRGYRPLRPVPLWPDLRALVLSARDAVESRDTDGPPEEGSNKTHRARRRKADQAERRDSLILHKFEAILSWAEFLNLNRRVDDDDPDSAKKAADDQEEIGLGQISKAPATRLKLHLDLAPEDVDRERLSGITLYPEWDTRTGTYLSDHVRVLDSIAPPGMGQPAFRSDPQARRRIHRVRQRFEALRPGRVSIPGQLDGDELDIEAAVRARVDILANGAGTNRIWRQTRPQARDLAVS
ncbi:MAG: nitric oxide reductase D protein, partial [Roseovarius sp.]|nr:nitric oxide reductase D protein [Roseovarius sp.]